LQNVRRFIDSGGTYTAKKGGGEKPASSGLSAAEQAELDQLRKRFGK